MGPCAGCWKGREGKGREFATVGMSVGHYNIGERRKVDERRNKDTKLKLKKLNVEPKQRYQKTLG